MKGENTGAGIKIPMNKIIIITYENIAKRLEELKKIKISINKSRSKEKILAYEKDLAEVQQLEKFWRKKAEACIEELDLQEEEKEIACNHYINLMKWEEAFDHSSLYHKLSLKACNSEFSDKIFEAVKRKIRRKILKSFRY